MRHNGGVTKQEIILANQECLFPAVFHYFREPLVLTRAKDQYVWDADGNQYLDFFGGILTVSVGHCNEKVNRAVHAQVDKLQHVSTVFPTEPQAALARKISTIAPGKAGNRSLQQRYRSERNGDPRGALFHRIVRYYRAAACVSRPVLAGDGGNGTIDLEVRAAGAGGDHFRAQCLLLSLSFWFDVSGLRSPLRARCRGMIRTTTTGQIAGMIAEPIQGVGGFITPPKEYFKIVSKIVREHGGVFISDEVQTAWGRTGNRWWGIEQWDVTPEIVTSAKGLANGFPIGLTAASGGGRQRQETHHSTFGGGPIPTAAAKAVIDLIEKRTWRETRPRSGLTCGRVSKT